MTDDSRRFNIVTTAFKASAVSGCLAANFTAPNQLNLLVAKNSRIEVMLVSPDQGLQPMLDVPLFGRIVTLRKFRPGVRKLCLAGLRGARA